MENSKYKRLKAFIDTSLPEVEKNTTTDGQIRTEFPQYEKFLDNVLREAQNARVDSFKRKLESKYFNTPENKSEPTAVESLLTNLGIDKNYINQLHYRTADERPLNRNSVDNYIYNLLMKSKHPETLVNEMRVAEDNGYSSPDDLEAIKKEKIQAAAGLVGMPAPSNDKVDILPNEYLKDAKGNTYSGVYDPEEDSLVIGENNFHNFDSTLAHELMHKKDWNTNKNRAGSPENVDNDFLSKDFSSAVKDRRINNWHHDESLQVPEASEVSGDEVPRGIRAGFFNRLKGLLKD